MLKRLFAARPYPQVEFLTVMIEANYGRLESRYYQLELAELHLRKLFNLAFDWFQEMIFNSKDGEGEWNRSYADLFDPPEEHFVDEAFEIDDDAGLVIAVASANGGASEKTV